MSNGQLVISQWSMVNTAFCLSIFKYSLVNNDLLTNDNSQLPQLPNDLLTNDKLLSYCLFKICPSPFVFHDRAFHEIQFRVGTRSSF